MQKHGFKKSLKIVAHLKYNSAVDFATRNGDLGTVG
jgi:hypothetical protein